MSLGPRYCYLPKKSITDIVILIETTAIMIVTTVIIKGKLLSGVTNFRTLYIFSCTIRTSRTEKCEEHMWKIFALVWNVPICSYYSISRFVFCFFVCFSFLFSPVYYSSFKYLTVRVYLLRKCKDKVFPFNVL